jgi:anti-sigma B factor antagonist
MSGWAADHHIAPHSAASKPCGEHLEQDARDHQDREPATGQLAPPRGRRPTGLAASHGHRCSTAGSTIIPSVHELFEGDRPPRPGELRIETTRRGTRTELTLAGELDLISAPQLESELMAVASPGAGELLIDLAEVQFIDSTGLRVLLGATKRADAAGQKLLVRHVHGQARRLFEIAGVIDRFSLRDD